MPKATWEPHEKHGRLTTESDLPASVYAFPKQRKEPLTDAQHVRNAVARFDQVIEVSDEDRDLAFVNILGRVVAQSGHPPAEEKKSATRRVMT